MALKVTLKIKIKGVIQKIKKNKNSQHKQIEGDNVAFI